MLAVADQPDMFLQRLLKQTKPYLVRKGVDSVRKFEEGLQEANSKAKEAEQEAAAVKNRDFDL